jgi:Sulfotransferase family
VTETQDVDRLRDELERAERKIAALKQVAETRKLRYQRAEAELDRLRGGWTRRAVGYGRQRIGLGELRSFCLFVGYPRSGHSLVGSLLDAHPDAVIAHEVHVLGLIAEHKPTRSELFQTLIQQSEADASRSHGRRATGYSYAVPGQWQGQVRRLRVIGAKAGEKTTIRLGRDPKELSTLRRLVRAPVRLVHVTRNPYDSIARMAAVTKNGRRERTVAGSTDFLRRLARINHSLIENGKAVLTVRHESLVADPRAELIRLAEFLELEPDQSWLSACASVVFPTPKRARDAVEWTDEERAAVEEVIARRPFFSGYGWEGE